MKHTPLVKFLFAFVLIAGLAAFLPLENLQFIRAFPAPPLFESLSLRSVDPQHWRAYFVAMSVFSCVATLIAFPVVSAELGPPRTKHIYVVSLTMIIFGLSLLVTLLSIDIDADNPLRRAQAMLGSTIGLALQGSLLMAGLFCGPLLAVIGIVAMHRQWRKPRFAP